MKIVVVTIGRSGSRQLIEILKKKVKVVNEPCSNLYPDSLLKKYGSDVKVIFITRNIVDVIDSIVKKENLTGIQWVRDYYKKLDSNFNDYTNLLYKDTLNFRKLFDAYSQNRIFPTLFIKYENLYFSNRQTLEGINSFLNTDFKMIDFKYNPDNKWKTTTVSYLSDKDKNEIRNNFRLLQSRIDSYVYKYKVSPEKLVKQIQLLKEKKSPGGKRHYRLSDVIRHRGFYWEESIEFILKHDHFKGTILRTFLERSPGNGITEINYDFRNLLRTIVAEKVKTGNMQLPKQDELVIHLRLGDVIQRGSFLKGNYIPIIEKHIKNYNISKVTFCTAFHYGNNIQRGAWMYSDQKHKENIIRVKKMFTHIIKRFNNIVINVKSTANIDSDFIYMVKARHFVKDMGGFSGLVKEVRHRQTI